MKVISNRKKKYKFTGHRCYVNVNKGFSIINASKFLS